MWNLSDAAQWPRAQGPTWYGTARVYKAWHATSSVSCTHGAQQRGRDGADVRQCHVRHTARTCFAEAYSSGKSNWSSLAPREANRSKMWLTTAAHRSRVAAGRSTWRGGSNVHCVEGRWGK